VLPGDGQALGSNQVQPGSPGGSRGRRVGGLHLLFAPSLQLRVGSLGSARRPEWSCWWILVTGVWPGLMICEAALERCAPILIFLGAGTVLRLTFATSA